MKKIILILTISLFIMGCYTNLAHSVHAGGGKIITYKTTTGQELMDLQEALDSGAITQEEYDELRKKIMERYDAPVDSTETN